MKIVLVGLSHKTAPVSVREQLYFPEDRLHEPLNRLSVRPEIEESFIVSTCNRVEICCAQAQDATRSASELIAFLSDYHQVTASVFESHLYTMQDEEAVKHIFRVASSLDSMVVGEAQILGQVKAAYQAAHDAGALGTVLNQILERAFTVAKRVRRETRIAENAVSVSYAAVELSKKIFGDLSGKTVMLIGAGEMAELAARHLINSGVKTLMVCNRTFSRAVELAEQLGGDPIRFESRIDRMAQADIVISSTAAGQVIISKDDVQQVIRRRKNRPMFFIDIAMPRDIESRVNEIEQVFLYDIDDLENVIETNIRERKKEAIRAEEIVQTEVQKFVTWFDSLDITPTIVALREKLDQLRQAEIERFLSRNGRLSETEKQAVEQLSVLMLNKFLHLPSVALKKHHAEGEREAYVRAVRKLFQLDD